MLQTLWLTVSGDITVSGGGSILVATATLLSQQQNLDTLSTELQSCLTRLRSIDGMVTRARLRAADAPSSSLRAETAMANAHDALHSASTRAASLADALSRAATAYGEVEKVNDAVARQLSSMIAYQLGEWLPVMGFALLPLLAPTMLAAAGVFAGVWAMTPGPARKEAVDRWVQDNKGVLSDPLFVSALRLAVTSSDDFGEGFLHFPEPLGEILGDDGLGILGVSSSAAVVVGAAGTVGMLKETPVRTTQTSSKRDLAPPTGLEDRAQRIPTGENQVRIDQYSQPGAPDRYEVYLGGTIDLSLTAGTEPWDMTSNLTGVAGGAAGSLVAARQAMKLAGIDSTTPVTFTGYSQGGLLAAELAASGDFDTRGLITFGGPAGQVSVPHDIPYVALEHADDLVPATGGVWKSSDPLLVTRTVYSDQPYTGKLIVPAHELPNYRETARVADASDEQRLSAMRNTLREFSAGTTPVQTSYFHAVRSAP